MALHGIHLILTNHILLCARLKKKMRFPLRNIQNRLSKHRIGPREPAPRVVGPVVNRLGFVDQSETVGVLREVGAGMNISESSLNSEAGRPYLH